MPYQSTNPATGKVLKTFKELTDTQLEKALRVAAIYEGATAKLKELGKVFSAWEAVARGADFPVAEP